MKEVLVNAIRSHLAGNINKHLANIQVYMNSTTGMGNRVMLAVAKDILFAPTPRYLDKKFVYKNRDSGKGPFLTLT